MFCVVAVERRVYTLLIGNNISTSEAVDKEFTYTAVDKLCCVCEFIYIYKYHNFGHYPSS
jgi:hypothetical protein